MTFTRWLPTFLGFPLGGLAAVEIVGSVDGPGSAAAAGALAGLVLGAVQALALRSRVSAIGWTLHTGVALSAGSAVAALIIGAGTTTPELVLAGVVAGAFVGAAQGPVLGLSARGTALLTAATSGAWALAWLVTAGIGVDVERGYVVFGASGAIVATVLTGLAMRSPRTAAAGAQS